MSDRPTLIVIYKLRYKQDQYSLLGTMDVRSQPVASKAEWDVWLRNHDALPEVDPSRCDWMMLVEYDTGKCLARSEPVSTAYIKSLVEPA